MVLLSNDICMLLTKGYYFNTAAALFFCSILFLICIVSVITPVGITVFVFDVFVMYIIIVNHCKIIKSQNMWSVVSFEQLGKVKAAMV